MTHKLTRIFNPNHLLPLVFGGRINHPVVDNLKEGTLGGQRTFLDLPMATWVLKILGVAADVTQMASANWTTILVLCAVLVVAIFFHYQLKARYIARLGMAAMMKHKVSDLVRNKYCDLFTAYYQPGIDDEARKKAIAKELENTGTEVVTLLAELLTSLAGHQVNVCIKAIENPRKPYPTTKEDWSKVYVYTLCRSAKSAPRPTSMPKQIAVSDNTDFMLLMRDEGDIFAIPDLKKYDKQLRKAGNKEGYLNSNSQWPDFYRSTIVAPIRVQATHLGIENVRYDLLGFLCADSMSTRVFPPRYIPHYSELMSSFGDDLYVYFAAVTFMNEQITQKRQAKPTEARRLP